MSRILPRLLAAMFALSLAACGAGDAVPVNAPLAASAARPPRTAAELAEVVSIDSIAVAPDGSEIAVVTDRSGAFEIWTLRLDGGGPAELRQRTRAGEHVSGPAYAPDGSALIFEMDQGGSERNDLWILRRGSDAPERLTETKTSEMMVRFSPDGKSIALAVDADREFRFNVAVMDLATRKTTVLTHEEVDTYEPRWSRDGKTIVAVRTPDEQRGELVVIDVASGKHRKLAPPRADGILKPVDFLPDGRLLALATNAKGFLQLATVDLASDAVAYVGPGDWDIEFARVAGDGSVFYARNVHGESEVAVAPGPTPFATPPRVLAQGGVVGAIATDHAGRAVFFSRDASNRPAEVLAIGREGGAARTLVPPVAGKAGAEDLVRAEMRTFQSFDGTRIDAFLHRPRVARLGSPPPCVVWAHGGPNSQFRGYFNPPVQALAEAGFFVVAPNYRGSTGYGRAFEDLNNKDWGGGDLKDLIAVVDALAKIGAIDRTRVGIMGGSYGGYLSLRAITASPEVWRAAVDMYGMPDLVEDYRITESRFGTWYQSEMGDPVHDATLFHDRSPIHTLDKVRAPLLVLQGENDTNVPKAESDLVVKALRDRGQPVEYKVYPNEGHGFTHRENRADSIARAIDFFVRAMGQPASR
jgi:dipeptidyl aminopeptidase/acylaminoacyl peptidase